MAGLMKSGFMRITVLSEDNNDTEIKASRNFLWKITLWLQYVKAYPENGYKMAISYCLIDEEGKLL